MYDPTTCPKCKTEKFIDPHVVMKVNNICGHVLCGNCIQKFFGKGGSQKCWECNQKLRMGDFRVQLYGDLAVDKELHIRKEVLEVYNKHEEDFDTFKDYNDYLEKVETIISNLVNGNKEDIAATKTKIDAYKKENKDLIQRNKNKPTQEQQELEKLEKEEASMKKKAGQRAITEKEEIRKKREANNEKLIDLLMFSDSSTEDIVASHKKSVAAQEQYQKETNKASNSGGYFEGRSSREDNNFKGLPLFSHEMAHNDGHSKMRLQVDPGGLITGETISQEVQEFLMDISEPVCRLEHNQEYQLTRYSLYAATCQGLKTDDIIKKLEELSRKKLPIEVIDLIKSTLHGTVKLVRKQNSFFVESTQPDAIRKLLKHKEIQECRFRPSVETVTGGRDQPPTTNQADYEADDTEEENPDLIYFEVKRKKVESLLRRCKVLEFLLPLEYDYQHDIFSQNININLKKGAVLRPYQKKALQKIFHSGRARSGNIVLPCGAGKSFLGVNICCMIGKRVLVLCNTNMSAEQWKQQFLMWSTVKEEMICIVTSDMTSNQYKNCSIFIGTYGMISFTGDRSARTERTMSWLKNQTWGIVLLDEVHTAPADTFKEVLMTLQAGCRLGLTATLVREDDKIDDLNFIIGPKLYEANWKQIESEGFIAKATCYVVPVSLTPDFLREYNDTKEELFFTLHPEKFQACQFLIKRHEKRGDKIIVFLDNVFALEFYANKLSKPFIKGKTSEAERLIILQKFKMSSEGTIFLSRVGDTSIDIPDASVVIQVSFQAGSRRQEAQRLGRILRPKDESNNDCYFYTLVSRDTLEEGYSKNRQSFLENQGYTYKTVRLSGMEDDQELHYKCKEDQTKLLNIVKGKVYGVPK